MEQVLRLTGSWYALYREELALGLLACVLLLMIFALFAVQRCRKQMRELTEKTKEMTKLALSQSGRNAQQDKTLTRAGAEEVRNVSPVVSPQNEEIFGSVIREIFP
ncbi:MAG: hypothetical protein LIO75_03775 [Lachnospiraceae bacterium]|nr:hypothetical protein [Lachnospiraceae bacterium]